jgi:hypothetical protein
MRNTFINVFRRVRTQLSQTAFFFRGRLIDLFVTLLGLVFIFNGFALSVRFCLQLVLAVLAVVSIRHWVVTRAVPATQLFLGSVLVSFGVGMISSSIGEPFANQTLFNWTGHLADSFPITQRLATWFFTLQATTRLTELMAGLALMLTVTVFVFPISNILNAVPLLPTQPVPNQPELPKTFRQLMLEFMNIREDQLPIGVSAAIILMFSRMIAVAVIPSTLFAVLNLPLINDWGMDRIRDQLYVEYLEPTRCAEKSVLLDTRIQRTSDDSWTGVRFKNGVYEYFYEVACTVRP